MADNQPAAPSSGDGGSSRPFNNNGGGRGRGGRGGRGGGGGGGNDRKRKFDKNDRGKGWGGGRGGGRNKGRRGDDEGEDVQTKSGEEPVDKRTRTQMWQQKRRRVDEDGNTVSLPATGPDGEQSYMRIQFSEAEIAAEERRPKRKVAVMIGYAGTGYHGLQINHKEKTIEGDIFAAFVAANAIAKTNADDPRKSSFVRCARTDKGVHAAGNMVSLKLIIEDPDVVQKINDNLPPQIRVWGITRTNNAFSSYQSCDSRWYEYLMPSYCLLPPHSSSFLGQKVAQYAKENGYETELAKRLEDVQNYWEDVEKNDIQPIMESLEESVREAVLARLLAVREGTAGDDVDTDKKIAKKQASAEQTTTKDEASVPAAAGATETATTEQNGEAMDTDAASTEPTTAPETSEQPTDEATADAAVEKEARPVNPVDQAMKRITAAYIAAKRRYRVTPARLAQLQEALDQYVGTRNYHNYTVQKNHNDPSAKRLIKSFQLNPEPVQINDTQWLSLKVHGQSFMMHQIRKMVGMAVLVTRCGTPLSRIEESYGPTRISIPKAPGLGLLLERPVFDSYNTRAKDMYNLESLDFGNYEKEIQKFKEEQIYQRIFELEEQQNSFHTFFHQVDNFKSDYFLWVTAGGVEAAQHRPGMKGSAPAAFTGDDDDDEGEDDAAAAKGGEGNEG